MRKKDKIVAALKLANDSNAPKRTVAEWSKELETSDTYLHFCAASIGFERFFKRRDCRNEGTVRVQLRATKYGTNPVAAIPVGAFRASGLDKQKTLRFRAEAGKITIEQMQVEEPDALSPQ